MGHDQVWKELLRAFFPDFIALFLPRIAAQLDFATTEFRDKETFTDLPAGRRREADLVAVVRSVSGEPEIVLVHVEVEAKRGADMPRRMWEYYHALRLRHRLRVLPIVVYLAGSDSPLRREQYVEDLFGDTYVTFRYWAVALASFSAERFLRAESPLGPAVSALMRSGRRGRVRHKLMALVRIARARVDDARRSLLAHVVGQYLELTPQQESEFERLIGETDAEEVADMVNIFEQKGIAKGREEGREEGRAIGLLLGEAQGMRQSLLWLMERKFGAVPQDVCDRLGQVSDLQRLGELTGRVLDAQSVEEMGI